MCAGNGRPSDPYVPSPKKLVPINLAQCIPLQLTVLCRAAEVLFQAEAEKHPGKMRI